MNDSTQAYSVSNLSIFFKFHIDEPKKQCLNCTIDKYGNTCLPEFVQYNLDIDENGITCLDGAGTCERNLCECDKEFAINHLTAESVYNRDFSNIYSGFPYQEICRKNPREIFDLFLIFLFLNFVQPEFAHGTKCHLQKRQYIVLKFMTGFMSQIMSFTMVKNVIEIRRTKGLVLKKIYNL